MGQYFDDTFFKFFFGFLAIIFVSLALLFVTRYFEDRSEKQDVVEKNFGVEVESRVSF